MKCITLYIALAILSSTAAEILPESVESPAESQASDNSVVDARLMTSYFNRLASKGLLYTQPRPQEFDFAVSLGNTVLPACVTVDEETHTVYLAIFVGRIPFENERAGKTLSGLMKQNFAINWGKIEWDKTKGDVRISYTFLTDDGLPFDEFTFILDQIQRNADSIVDKIDKELKG